MVKIALRKSLIGRTEKQRRVVKGLGLRKINSEVIKEKSPEIMGMVNKVYFLLEVTEVSK
ncbi:MAG: 50S ribosomal protein L30 [Candidatus Aminicenantes bacterium]|nr:50S ribosomal protein L30 [Candidatus Aminicenantes bacterium]